MRASMSSGVAVAARSRARVTAAPGRFASGLDRRQQQRDQESYDGDDNEQLNERKAP